MMRLCLDGLYPCPEVVQSVLAPVPGMKKYVLDLGWSMIKGRFNSSDHDLVPFLKGAESETGS
jgi:hypothetical protein